MDNFSNTLLNRFFRKVDNVVWDLLTGRIGVQTSEGITTIEGSGEDAQVTINLFDQFGMPVPAFAQSTPLNAVNIGDLIYAEGRPRGWVIALSERPGSDDKPGLKRFTLMTPSGSVTTWTPPKLTMLGFDSGVMVLRSLMNMLPGGEAGLSNMQSMLMPMMMMGEDVDMDTLMPMILFSQLGAKGTGADTAAGNNMVQMMMMMQMMKTMGGGKKGGGNPGKGFFD